MSRLGKRPQNRGGGIPWRLSHRDLPAGTFSTKDALDDGNAYGSAAAAAAGGWLMWWVAKVKHAMPPGAGPSHSVREFAFPD